MIAGVRRAIIGPHHQINYGASKAENGVPEVQTARSNGQGSRLGAHHVQRPEASPVSRSTPNCATAQRPVLPASWASSTTSNGPPQHRRPERADLPAATHTATTAGPGPPKHPSKHLHLTPPSGGLYRLREVRNVSPGDPSCRFEFRVFRHECGSPNGFELGFLLLRQRFWAGAAGLWFVPVLRRFFSGSRQFG